MLDAGAEPTIGTCVDPGPVAHVGQCSATAFLNGLAGANVKTTLAEIMPATNVPCPLLALLLNPNASGTRFSPPITDPSSEMCGNPGRMPLSITATFMPCPSLRAPCSAPSPSEGLLIR